MKYLPFPVIAIVLLLTACPAAYAQFNMGDPIFTMPTLVLDAHAKAKAATPAHAASLTYISTSALRQQTVTTFVKRLQSQNPQQARQLSAAFEPGKTDYEQLYRQMLKSLTLHDNDVADVLTGLLIVGYQIVNNMQDAQIMPAMEHGARAQVAASLAQNPKMASVATRAQVAEEFKLQSVLLASGWQDALKAKTQAAAYQQGVSTLFQNQYHINMTQVELTARGFAGK